MGRTDLHIAALAGNAERVKELLKKRRRPKHQRQKGQNAATYSGA
jgi:ankyrin repeat protein